MSTFAIRPSNSRTALSHRRRSRLVAAAISFMIAAPSLAATTLPAADASDAAAPALSFRDGHFEPATLTVPANAPVALRVTNLSGETIEFESFKLNRERVIGPGGTITVQLPPLSPGTYDFYDDFHQNVPEGSLVAK